MRKIRQTRVEVPAKDVFVLTDAGDRRADGLAILVEAILGFLVRRHVNPSWFRPTEDRPRPTPWEVRQPPSPELHEGSGEYARSCTTRRPCESVPPRRRKQRLR